ncbi:uncharacterized protein LOC120358514 [Solenopsis invicta]|uniref:uncharacterized protein LOC120358514 n=1 Tax=Solenopsis invicta TaxID=13686 RepID=UPI00193D4A7A|nr:uncharacterized protein LOC120358514 [Solenopsis invicta]
MRVSYVSLTLVIIFVMTILYAPEAEAGANPKVEAPEKPDPLVSYMLPQWFIDFVLKPYGLDYWLS